jgi:hypothetical protein
MLSIRGTNFIAGRAYAERISSLAEHEEMFKSLGQIEHDFQKSRVTGPWNHKVSVSAKKVKKKISCLCTFKGQSVWLIFDVWRYKLQASAGSA